MPMVISTILLIVFLGGLFFFGWQVARFTFKTNRLELLLPISPVIGYGFYTFFLNLFSYFIPIKLNFYLIFFIFLIIAFVLFFLKKERPGLEWGLSKRMGFVIFLVAFLIMILSGLLASREIATDELAGPHLPSAVIISQGGFPVKDLNLPDDDLAVHYGPNLFYAAISKITGFSVIFSFRLSAFILSGVIFLLIFNIAKLFIKDDFGAFLVAMAGMFGGGFHFIYGFSALVDLYQKFFLNWDIEHPFKFFGYMWGGLVTAPLVAHIFYSWGAFGWSLALGVIYLYLKCVDEKKYSYACSFVIVILLAVLALSNEIVFVCICFGFLVFPLIFYFQDQTEGKGSFKLLFRQTMLILAAAGILVIFQGGTITTLLKNIVQQRTVYGSGLEFSLFRNFLSFEVGNDRPLPLFGWVFILDFGLIYFLIIPVVIFFIKQHHPENLFLILISGFAFLVPFITFFGPLWQGTLNRFFWFSSLIWGILVGLFLVTILSRLKRKDFFRIIIYVCLFVICLDGYLFLLTRSSYRKDENMLDNSSWLAKLIPPAEIEASAYRWVQENSSIKDYFLVFASEREIDNQPSVLENFRFVFFAKRLAPVYTYSNNYFNSNLPPHPFYSLAYRRLIFDCNKIDMKLLNYKYLFVDNHWPIGLAEKCLANNRWELKFEAKNETEFYRIYRVLN